MDNDPLQLPLFKLGRLIVRLKPELIDALGVEALQFIDDNFRKQGFQGTVFQPWDKLKRPPKGKSRKILINTSTLRRSPKQTNYQDHTEVSTDIEYAQIHNEGGTITKQERNVILSHREKKGRRVFSKAKQATSQVKATIYAHSYHMPQRRFAGDSPVLRTNAIDALANIISKNAKQL